VLVFQIPIDVPAGEHKLQYAYCLWFSRRSPGKQASVQNYDQNLKLIGCFASVEQFWALYSHLVRPSDLQSHSDFHLFKVGIKPMWEVSFMLAFLLFSSSSSSLFLLVCLLNHWCTLPLRLHVSVCTAFLIMCDIPSTTVFYVEYLECFPGIP